MDKFDQQFEGKPIKQEGGFDMLSALYDICAVTKTQVSKQKEKQKKKDKEDSSYILDMLLADNSVQNKVQKAIEQNMTVEQIRKNRDLAEFKAKNQKIIKEEKIGENGKKKYAPKMLSFERNKSQDKHKEKNKNQTKQYRERQKSNQKEKYEERRKHQKKHKNRQRGQNGQRQRSYEKQKKKQKFKYQQAKQRKRRQSQEQDNEDDSFIENDQIPDNNWQKHIRSITKYNPNAQKFKKLDKMHIQQSSANQIFKEQKKTAKFALELQFEDRQREKRNKQKYKLSKH